MVAMELKHSSRHRNSLILIVILSALIVDLTEARVSQIKNKKIHKFFDDSFDDTYVAEDDHDTESASHETLTSSQLPSTNIPTVSTPGKILSSSTEKFLDSNNSLNVGKKQPAPDPCAGVRCRIGRVCRSDDEFNEAWCVCAGVGHCVDHGRRVCASDGQFYFSHCEMHRIACIKNQHIRANHDESECIRRITNTEPVSRQSLTPTLTTKRQLSEEATVKYDDRRPDDVTVDVIGAETTPPAEATEKPCTEQEYSDMTDRLLQLHCAEIGNDNCASGHSQLKHVADDIFRFLDNSADDGLDLTELDSMERRSRPGQLSAQCHLRHMLTFSDKNADGILSRDEFFAAMHVPALDLDERLKVFTMSATVGTSLELRCDISGATDIIWKHSGHLLTDISDNRIKVFDDGSLYISDVSIYHVGNYSCQEKQNDELIQVHIITIRVPPLVRVSPKTRFVAPLTSIVIRCHVEGIPEPEVSWSANEMPLSERPDHYMLLHNGLSLQIKDANYSVDTGTYKCRASNFVGISEDVATIFVENSNSAKNTFQDELFELFVVFHDLGYNVYEPSHCHIHHVVKGNFMVVSRDVDGQLMTLCDSNATCDWGSAVNVRNTFVYVAQPKLNRVVVIEVQDRFNPVEIIPTDQNPVEIAYVEHLDQVWVSCAAKGGIDDEDDSWKTLMVIQRASADVRHNIVHTQPIADKFDVVRGVYLPPSNAFKQTYDYGIVIRGEFQAMWKVDLNTLTYVKHIDLDLSDQHCSPERVAFIPLAGKMFVSCRRKPLDSANATSWCLAIDYVTDRPVDFPVRCGHPYVSPDSRHVVIVAEDRVKLSVYSVEDDGLVKLEFDETIDMRIGDVTFVSSETGYDLYANSLDKPVILYMSLVSGRMEVIKDKADDAAKRSGKNHHVQPIVGGSVFSDYLLTPYAGTLQVVDTRRRHIHCQWQGVGGAVSVAWVEVWNRY